jgi:hypothetical protein
VRSVHSFLQQFSIHLSSLADSSAFCREFGEASFAKSLRIRWAGHVEKICVENPEDLTYVDG